MSVLDSLLHPGPMVDTTIPKPVDAKRNGAAASAPGVTALPNGQNAIPRMGAAPTPPTCSSWADLAQMLGPITWAWERWLANGFLTLLASESGKGKSSLALRLAGCFLCGWDWPDGSPFTGQRGAVLWCEAEGGQPMNNERAFLWGLPTDRLLSPLANPMDSVSLNNRQHRAAIAAAASRPDVRLVVLDSLSGATLGRDENSAAMLEAVKYLSDLARDSGKPVLCLHHTRKKSLVDGGEITLDRVRGASHIVQLARLVWILDTPNAADKETRRLAVLKSNLARFPKPLGLTIDDAGLHFGEAPQPLAKETAVSKAEAFLLEQLRGGEMSQAAILAAAAHADIADRTLDRAKRALGVTSIKRGGVWFWAMPSSDDDFGDSEEVGALGALGAVDTVGALGALPDDEGQGRQGRQERQECHPSEFGALDADAPPPGLDLGKRTLKVSAGRAQELMDRGFTKADALAIANAEQATPAPTGAPDADALADAIEGVKPLAAMLASGPMQWDAFADLAINNHARPDLVEAAALECGATIYERDGVRWVAEGRGGKISSANRS